MGSSRTGARIPKMLAWSLPAGSYRWHYSPFLHFFIACHGHGQRDAVERRLTSSSPLIPSSAVLSLIKCTINRRFFLDHTIASHAAACEPRSSWRSMSWRLVGLVALISRCADGNAVWQVSVGGAIAAVLARHLAYSFLMLFANIRPFEKLVLSAVISLGSHLFRVRCSN